MIIFIWVIVWIKIILYIIYLLLFICEFSEKLLSILYNSFIFCIFDLGNKGFFIVDLVFLIGLIIGMWKGVGYFIDIFRIKIVSLIGVEWSV